MTTQRRISGPRPGGRGRHPDAVGHPKVLHTLAGRSMLAHSLHAIAKMAPQHLVVVLGRDHQRIEQAIARTGRDPRAPDRHGDAGPAARHRPRGAVRPVGAARRLPRRRRRHRPATSRCSTPTRWPTWSPAHNSRGAAVTVLTTTLSDPTGYGRTLRTQDHEVIAIVEQADATPSQQEIREVNAGVYAFDIAALRSALSRLSADNAQQELYLTDVIAIVRQDGQVVQARHVDDSSLVAGVNNRVQLAELAAELNRRIVSAHQLAGVTVVDPATTWIDVDVTIGRDTVIQPGTQLLGGTRIGGRCAIGPDTTLTDVAVGDGASVVRTHGTDAVDR